MDAYLTTEKKPLAKKSPFHDESLARKSKFLEQSGGGGGGWVWALGPQGPKIYYSKGIFSQLEGGVLWTLT